MKLRLEISAEEVTLVREQAECLLSSFTQGKGTPARKQPTEWHEGQKLMALAKKLAAYRRQKRLV